MGQVEKEEMMEQLIEFSRGYGGDGRYVLAGGGNTSCKSDGILYVKASGTKLADISEDGFVRMDMPKLLAMLEKRYPAGDAKRERAALADMTAAVLPGQEGKRPSVECLLHALFPQRFVLHLHPALVNGLCCAKDGKEYADLLGYKAVWIPLTKPGYILAKTCDGAFRLFEDSAGEKPKIVFMQNHGLIVAADTVSELDELTEEVMSLVRGVTAEERPETGLTDLIWPGEEAEPDFSPVYDEMPDVAARLEGKLLACFDAVASPDMRALFHASPAVLAYLESEETARPLLRPFTPDQIVYCKGAYPLLDAGDDIGAIFAAFVRRYGYEPKIVLVKRVGLFALGRDQKDAETALALFLDAVKIAAYAEYFGGPLPLTDDFVDFISNWEAENYRQKVAQNG